MRLLATLSLTLALSTGAVPAATISNGAASGNIGSFGTPNFFAGATQTYGQVFTAPITGIMTSFTMTLNGSVGALIGAVGTWNGTAAFGTGFGSDTTLYASSATPATTAGPYTFSPSIAVTAGSIYVAFLTTFGVTGASGRTSMPRVTTDSPGINYFVWNNNANPFGDSSWNYFANFGDVAFSASFDPPAPPPASVPLPASLSLFLAALAGLGLTGWRRRKA